MGGINSKLKNILNKYDPEDYFKVKLNRRIKIKDIKYLKQNDKLYILFFEDYLIITDKEGNEKFNISYYNITSWCHNISLQFLSLNLSSNYSEKIPINKLCFNCYNNNTKNIINCLNNKTRDLLNYTNSL